MACIETYFKTEDITNKRKNLACLINESESLDEEEKNRLHMIRKYRNRWVHADRLDDNLILQDDTPYAKEAEKMAIFSVRLLLKVLFLNPLV